MIRGTVDAFLQPKFEIPFRGIDGEIVPVDLKLDTGFNGELGLSSVTLERLAKSFLAEKTTRFGNGHIETLLEFEVECIIDGQPQRLAALDLGSDGGQVLGMRALPSWTGCVEFKINGDVTIQKPN